MAAEDPGQDQDATDQAASTVEGVLGLSSASMSALPELTSTVDVDENALLEDGEIAFKPYVFVLEFIMTMFPLIGVPYMWHKHGKVAVQNRWYWGNPVGSRFLVVTLIQWFQALLLPAGLTLFFLPDSDGELFTVELLAFLSFNVLRAITIGIKYAFFSTEEYDATLTVPLTIDTMSSKMMLGGWRAPPPALLTRELRVAVLSGLRDVERNRVQPVRFVPVSSGYCRKRSDGAVDSTSTDFARLVVFRQFGGRTIQSAFAWSRLMVLPSLIIPYAWRWATDRPVMGGSTLSAAALMVFSASTFIVGFPCFGFLLTGVVDYARRRGANFELASALERGIKLCLDEEGHMFSDVAYKFGVLNNTLSPSSVLPLVTTPVTTETKASPVSIPLNTCIAGFEDDSQPYTPKRLPLDHCTRLPMFIDLSVMPANVMAWMRARSIVQRVGISYRQRVNAFSLAYLCVVALMVLYLLSTATVETDSSTGITLLFVIFNQLMVSGFILAMVSLAAAANSQVVLAKELLIVAKMRAQRRLLYTEANPGASAPGAAASLRATIGMIESAIDRLAFDTQENKLTVAFLTADYSLFYSLFTLSLAGPLLAINQMLGGSTPWAS